MKESNFLAGNATIEQRQKEILLNMEEQYMKESNILAANASIKQHQKDILLDTRGQCMNELDSHAVIVINNIHPEIILQSIRNLHL